MTYTWDSDNKLRSADIDANGTADVNFQYDALGRRVARTGTGGSVVFVQMDQQTIADYPVGGAATTPTFRYVYASYIDEPVVRKGPTSTSTAHFYHRNHQYSVTAVTTSTGAIAERYAYTAYGQPTILNASGAVISATTLSNRYSYTGREWDATLVLHHFRARWMSPSAGRFLTRDPIGFLGSAWNLYESLGTAPLARVDPLGFQSKPVDEPSSTIPDMTLAPIPCPPEAHTKATDYCRTYGGVKSGPKCFKGMTPLGHQPLVVEFTCKDHDCDWGIHQWIKDRKDAYCKVDGVSTSCAEIDCPCDRKSCGKIWNNIRDNRGCWKAREDEANLCFKGRENAGHKEARENAKKAFDTCQDKRKECKCSYVFTP